MGSTKGVQPSWRLATISIHTIPNASCPQRDPPYVARRISAVPNAVTTVVPSPRCHFPLCRSLHRSQGTIPAPAPAQGLRSASCTLEQQESQTGSLIQALLFSTLLLPPEKLLKELLTRRIAILRRLGRCDFFLHRGKLVRG